MTPTVRLELEAMKHTVMFAFTRHQDEIKKQVEEGLTKAMANFDMTFGDFINREICRVFEEEITRYFNSGIGRHTIRDLVKKGLDKDEKTPT